METQELEAQLKTIKADILAAVGKDSAKLADLEKKQKEIQQQLDAVDLATRDGHRHVGGEPEMKGIGDLLVASDEFKAAQASKFAQRNFRMALELPIQRKSTITTTSGITAATSGITVPQRLPGIVAIAQQKLRIRDLMTIRPMNTGNAFDFVRQTTRTNLASPQVEPNTKAESTYAWDTQSRVVSTIAHFVNVTRQALDDVPWLTDQLNRELTYGLSLKEETEILSGDGLGAHMLGIIPQATAYASGTYNVSGDTKLDVLNHAKLQARLAGLGTFAPDAYVLHPADIAKIQLLKTEEGGANKGVYIVGNPATGGVDTIWGLPVVESDSITAGTFLVGAFQTAAEVVSRQEIMIEISFEHASNFTANIATVLAELRSSVAVMRPGAFIYGSY